MVAVHDDNDTWSVEVKVECPPLGMGLHVRIAGLEVRARAPSLYGSTALMPYPLS